MIRIIITICLTFLSGITKAQNLAGVVNTYYPVSAVNITEATVSVGNSAGLSIGDTLIIIQMKGAQIDLSSSDSYGDVQDYGGAGNYELVEICDIQGNDVILKTRLEKYYDGTATQLISFPSSSDPIVSGTVTCDTWDGNTGGVVVIKAENSLSLNADIDVSGKGFRGGGHFYANATCNAFSNFGDYEYDLSSERGGIKGEGIAEFTSMNCGKGALANGGGGGNDHNSGGAGGGNVTSGGNGGDNDDPGTWRCKGYHPGKGGKALDHTSGRIFLGGGGGGGHSNSAPTPYQGGNGGGIVLLIADEIVGNGGNILANGTNGGDGIGDGGAGAGAGGTILFYNNTFSGTISTEVIGGDGGNGDGATSVTNVNTDRCFGPGGGGSGGFVWFNHSTQPSNVSVNLSGGVSGVVSGSTHTPCLGLTQGAEGGEDGLIDFNDDVVMGRKINTYCSYNPVLDIGNDTILCEGQNVTYTSNITGSYDWSTGSTTISITAATAGTYMLEVDDGVYIYCDSAVVSTDAPFGLDLGDDIYLCENAPVVLSSPAGFASYLWSTGESSSDISISEEGLVWIEVGGAVCSATDSINVFNETFTDPIPEEIIELCEEGGAVLNAGYAGGIYSWSTGASSQSITVTEPSEVSVSILSANNCPFEDQVELVACLDVDIPNTITPNGDGVNDTWIIKQVYSFPDNQIEIYDRSGRQVYATSGYENDWDGNGLPATVYYYSVILEPGFAPLKGTITIIRE